MIRSSGENPSARKADSRNLRGKRPRLKKRAPSPARLPMSLALSSRGAAVISKAHLAPYASGVSKGRVTPYVSSISKAHLVPYASGVSKGPRAPYSANLAVMSRTRGCWPCPAWLWPQRSQVSASAARAQAADSAAPPSPAAQSKGGNGALKELNSPPKQQHQAADGPWLLVGLGNPGSKYDGTRHNIGFEIVDALARDEGISMASTQCKAQVGKGRIGGASVVLAKPQTYMNVSGESVVPLAKFYKIPASRILVMFDDLDLDVATVKLLSKGGHGGHNGMRSIIEKLGGDKNFPRLRFGIGRPPGRLPTADYVLRKFGADERIEVDIAIERAKDGIRMVLSQGLDRAVSQFNQPKKTAAVGS